MISRSRGNQDVPNDGTSLPQGTKGRRKDQFRPEDQLHSYSSPRPTVLWIGPTGSCPEGLRPSSAAWRGTSLPHQRWVDHRPARLIYNFTATGCARKVGNWGCRQCETQFKSASLFHSKLPWQHPDSEFQGFLICWLAVSVQVTSLLG